MQANSQVYPITGIQDGLDSNKNAELRKVPLRMEIDTWSESQEIVHINQRALFFPAFWRFSQMDPKEKLSWFQIAGIHGKPYVAWDEDPQDGKTEDEGYCTHNSILFSTWHRPYMLLWEQVIYELMKEEAKRFPASELSSLLEAAKLWRFPYWDWALKKEDPNQGGKKDYTVPLVIRSSKVSVKVPVGPGSETGFGEVENAFYQFTMPGNISMGDDSLKSENPKEDLHITPSKVYHKATKSYVVVPYDTCMGTSRHVGENTISQDWIDGKQNNEAIEAELRSYKYDPDSVSQKQSHGKMGKLSASLRDAFYRVLTIEKFEDFATKRMPNMNPNMDGNNKTLAYDSAENIHDNMHRWCGGGITLPDDNGRAMLGHMSHVPLAAFDPIFWLHHCNVDRLFAIWQVLHDDTWFVDNDVRNKDEGNFFLEANHDDKSTDLLRPFHNEEGKYFTSNTVRSVTSLGYTYGGLEKWLYLKQDGAYDKEKHLSELHRKLLSDYGASWKAAQASHFTDDPGEVSGVNLAHFTGKIDAFQPVNKIEIDDYVVDVVYEKFALNGRMFVINIFIGKVPQPPYTFSETDSPVGQVVNFSSELPDRNTPGCGNCRVQQDDNALSSGRVVLTNALITRWKNRIAHTPLQPGGVRTLDGMDPNSVVPFLKDNLHWRVTSLGEEVDIATQLPSLRVSLAVGKADHFADRSKMSRFYDYKDAHVVTEGRPGGATHDEGLHWDHWGCEHA